MRLGLKISIINGPGHISKMATMPIFGKQALKPEG